MKPIFERLRPTQRPDFNDFYSPQHGKILALIFAVYFIGVVLFGVFFP